MPIGAFRLNTLGRFQAPSGGGGTSLTGSLLYTLNNPNPYGTSVNDYFGCSSSISELYAIVGAYAEDEASGTSSGKAYVYSTSTGALLYTLNNPNPVGTPLNDNFGFSVGITDNYIIVGAYIEDDAAVDSGKAYVYSTSTGALLYTLNNPSAYGTTSGDYFGRVVGITDNYIIVGAPQEDDIGGTQSGKAYIFSTPTGALLYTLNNPNAYGTSQNDSFGWAVAISNDYAIVGAYAEDEASGTSSGKAYIFSTSTGALLYTLNNPNAYGTPLNDYFGISVAITDNYAIVGAYLEADAGGTTSGKAYVYSTSTGALLYTLNNPNAYSTSVGDNFGRYIAITDTYIIASANLEDDEGGTSSGKAYIFSTPTGALLYTLNNPNAYGPSAGDNFGYSVGITDTYAIVSANQEDDASGGNSGKAYIFN